MEVTTNGPLLRAQLSKAYAGKAKTDKNSTARNHFMLCFLATAMHHIQPIRTSGTPMTVANKV